MYRISRDEIPAINSIIVDGKQHNLGLLKDLRRHHLLKNLLPETCRLSISWVQLKENEVLKVHQHPTASMIIVTTGYGKTLGDLNVEVCSGDIIFISPGKLHGFVGGSPEGFWGLSIQFEDAGLYENLDAPRVLFKEPSNLCPTIAALNLLMSEQKQYLNEYYHNPLIKLVCSPLSQKIQVKEKLLACLQLWSNSFQRVLFAKAAFGNLPEFQNLSEIHITEEIGHNKTLAELGGSQDYWEPALASACSWFIEQMLRLSEAEKVILVHFVLEGSGKIFHNKAKWLFPEGVHFNLHDECDDEHFQAGYKLLQAQTNLQLIDLRKTLNQGWRMMNHLCSIIAELALEDSAKE